MTMERNAAMDAVNGLWETAVLAAAVASALTDRSAQSPADVLAERTERAAVLQSDPRMPETLGAVWNERAAVGSAIASVLSQASAAATGTTKGWSDLSDEVMRAQGEASALMASTVLSRVAPAYRVLGDGGPWRVLDVGTGVGAIATALAAGVPEAVVTGIDIDARPLAIAAARLRDVPESVAERVALRLEDVVDLDEIDAYDVVWMPVPFIPDAIIDQALTRVAAALRPGGLLVLGTIPGGQRTQLRAASAWLAALAGGSTLTTEDVVDLVNRRGFSDLRLFETVEGGPVILAAVAP